MALEIKNKARKKEEERLLALLALASQEPTDKGPCPSDSQMTAFADGNQEPETSESVWSHLTACPECYRKWRDMPLPNRKPSIRQYFKKSVETCRDFIHYTLYLLFVEHKLATAFLIIIFVGPGYGWHQYNKIDNRITRTFKFILNQKKTLSHTNLSLPWHKPMPYGFTSSNRHAPYYRAFGAGVWAGRQELSGEKESSPMPDFLTPKWKGKNNINEDQWSDTQWAIYFSMGRGFYILRAVCLSDAELPDTFREQQASILNKIQKGFEKAEKTTGINRIMTTKLGNIRSILEDPNRNFPGKEQRREIASELDTLINRMSPKRIPE